MKSLLVDALRQLEEDSGEATERPPLPPLATQDALELEDDASMELNADVERDVQALTLSDEAANPLSETMTLAIAANEGDGNTAVRHSDGRQPVLQSLPEAGTSHGGFSADTPWLQRAARHTPALCIVLGLLSAAGYFAYAHALSLKGTLGVALGTVPADDSSPNGGQFGNSFALQPNAAAKRSAAEPRASSGIAAEPASVAAPAPTAARADDPVFAIVGEAYRAWRDGKPELAERLYRDALQTAPRHSGALEGLAAVLSSQGRLDEAQKLYARLLSVDPDNPAATAALLSETSSDDGVARLRVLSERYPDSAPVSFALGRRLAELDQWADAHLAFDTAYRRVPARADYAFNLAVASDRIGRYQRAAALYRRSLELDSPAGQAHRSRALARLAELSPLVEGSP
ncbi:MAG: tetratricopeptide repeat protein [Pseudomonadota bacterium]